LLRYGVFARQFIAGKSGVRPERTSAVNFSQITTVDKEDLTEQVAMLPKHMLEKMNSCLKIVLEIP